MKFSIGTPKGNLEEEYRERGEWKKDRIES
jgi:hypothetical protein